MQAPRPPPETSSSSEPVRDPASNSANVGQQTATTPTAEPPVSYLVTRDQIPHFRGETSASEPLKRNAEGENYIRAIENIVRLRTDESYIRAARASCRGRADMIINSECFDGIRDWAAFKRLLREKFRGTYTSTDFFKVLADHVMGEHQGPMDFYLQIEASVYQGYQDHRDAVGDPRELIRRTFLGGLPQSLCELLTLKDGSTAQHLAETAQKLWNSRHGIRHGGSQLSSNTRHQSPNEVLDNYPPRMRQVGWQRPNPYGVYPMEAGNSRPQSTWCTYHRSSTHNTQDCRGLAQQQQYSTTYAVTCYRCGEKGHISRNCRFPPGQRDVVPGSTGNNSRGNSYPIPGADNTSTVPQGQRDTMPFHNGNHIRRDPDVHSSADYRLQGGRGEGPSDWRTTNSSPQRQ